MIKFIDVSFSYGKKLVLDNINLTINRGDFILFLGQNGSGKSTTVKLILNYLKGEKGLIERKYNDYCYMPEKTILPDYISIGEFLYDLSYISKNCNYEKYLEIFNMEKSALIGSLSKGNKQKVALIQLLMEDKDLYVLDEPTNGLDQESINILIKLLKEKNKQGKTVIVVTHYRKLFQRWKIKKYEFIEGKINEIS
ncbi:MAG: ATP-binding cassette domain-containing protein [Acholeplasmatales bacterium]|nr:ATP-binding cassette domain-containing protein [Acholeplasmatales bacterium]